MLCNAAKGIFGGGLWPDPTPSAGFVCGDPPRVGVMLCSTAKRENFQRVSAARPHTERRLCMWEIHCAWMLISYSAAKEVIFQRGPWRDPVLGNGKGSRRWI